MAEAAKPRILAGAVRYGLQVGYFSIRYLFFQSKPDVRAQLLC